MYYNYCMKFILYNRQKFMKEISNKESFVPLGKSTMASPRVADKGGCSMT